MQAGIFDVNRGYVTSLKVGDEPVDLALATVKSPLPEDAEEFESLDSLKAASNSLLPPFKTVKVQNEPLLEGFGIKSTNKTYTQSQTIVVTSEHNA